MKYMEEGWLDTWAKTEPLRSFQNAFTDQDTLKVSKNGVGIALIVQPGKSLTRNKEHHYKRWREDTHSK